MLLIIKQKNGRRTIVNADQVTKIVKNVTCNWFEIYTADGRDVRLNIREKMADAAMDKILDAWLLNNSSVEIAE